ncbi:MAG: type II toxin-antitoxin system RelB/DinJ family antitoxin [Oscillospiraceae bacterium]|nr:type II toxin-antitoxin system RelB/DinJ family antitoxin [Oscillospiraceae bacterium]
MPKSVAIRIDDELKRQAEATLDEIGLNMTTYVTSSLKALVREQGVPFEMTTKQRANEQYTSKPDDAFEDLLSSGGFEHLGKDNDGTAKFDDTGQGKPMT